MPLLPLISDLAIILVIGAIVTLLFKWLKQPVVLGYIVAGFLASPHFSLLPTITDQANLSIWAEIGIIILLFSLGLEFSFKKLVNVGVTALITATTIVLGMMALGYSIGILFGFTSINSLFLGGMLSMSSTTIIIKAFTDLGMRKQPFTSLVFGVLIVEDLFAILTMVVLTSIAVNNQLEGSELFFSIAKLSFFLILWFIVGTYMLPTFLRKVHKYLNSETLLVFSLGLCLLMVVLASKAGFSPALGAFVMGSIFAGTVEAERVEKVVAPVKDLFGAVFFISVGMMVDPMILYQYAWPILLLSVVVIIGQIFFATSGMLLSGQSLRIAIKSGFSLAQIGEFAFIIATLGMSLKVIEPYLYPIVVAVSVVTTFTTPYFIKGADRAYAWIDKKMPTQAKEWLDKYSLNAGAVEGKNPWKDLLINYLGKLTIYTIIIGGIIALCLLYLKPLIYLHISAVWAPHLFAIISILILSPFLWSLSIKKVGHRTLLQLLAEKRSNQVPLITMSLLRILLGLLFLLYFLSQIYPLRFAAIAALIVFIFTMIFISKKFRKKILEVEKQFMSNLNQRELRRTGKQNKLTHDIQLAHIEIGANAPFIGRRLIDANLRKLYGINVAGISRGEKRINIPRGEERIFPGDVVSVIGTDSQIQQFLQVVEQPEEISAEEKKAERISLEKVVLSPQSQYVGVSLSESGIRSQLSCMIIGVERLDGTFLNPTGALILQANDIIWVAGERKQIAILAQK